MTSHTASIGLGEPRSFIAILAVGVLIGCVLASTVLFFARPTIVADVNDTQDHDPRMAACIGKVIDVVKPPKLNVGLYERVWRICGNQIYNSLYLEDFNIRRQKVIRQELDERVNLFMVVTMTLFRGHSCGNSAFSVVETCPKGKSRVRKREHRHRYRGWQNFPQVLDYRCCNPCAVVRVFHGVRRLDLFNTRSASWKTG